MHVVYLNCFETQISKLLRITPRNGLIAEYLCTLVHKIILYMFCSIFNQKGVTYSINLTALIVCVIESRAARF